MRENTPKLTPEFKVTEFQKSLNFYTNLAGFKVLYDRPENSFAMLDKDGVRIMIELLTDKSRTHKLGQLEYPFGRGMHLQIEVSAIQPLYDNFKKKGYPIYSELEDKWYRASEVEVGNRQFWVQDPDGYVLRFFEDIGVK
jgi:catechol 2,3-dioxygenase-like lactoylglutathione lyase family enzyme